MDEHSSDGEYCGRSQEMMLAPTKDREEHAGCATASEYLRA